MKGTLIQNVLEEFSKVQTFNVLLTNREAWSVKAVQASCLNVHRGFKTPDLQRKKAKRFSCFRFAKDLYYLWFIFNKRTSQPFKLNQLRRRVEKISMCLKKKNISK